MAAALIIPLRLGPFWNFSYIVGCPATGEAVVIDPAWDVPAILAKAAEAGLRPTAAVVTHGHDDHTRGLDELVRSAAAEVLVHHGDAAQLRRIYAGHSTRVEDGYELALGSACVRLLHTPGHTPGSLCVLADGALFTGDTLMVGALGRIGAEAGAVPAMWHTISNVLAPLPDTTIVYPGHDYGPRSVSTLGYERAVNQALTARGYDEFVQHLGR